MREGEEATRFSPRRHVSIVGGRSANIWQLTLARSLVPPSLIASCESASHMRQTHHLSLICCRIGSGEVTKKGKRTE